MNIFNRTNLGRQHLLLTGLALAAMLLAATLPFSGMYFSPTMKGGSWQAPLINLLPAEARAPITAAIGADLSGYHARPAGAGLALLNDAQGLKLSVSKGRAALSAGELTWDMRLRAWGYGDDLAALPAAAPTAQANRVEFKHAGLVEWYVNSPLGLEQGFTLLAPPAGTAGQALSMELGLPQGVAASPLSQTALALGSLTYSGLAAWDADGKALPAWMELSDDSLRLRVDAAGARYPVTVDPWVQQAKLTASDGAAGDEFGTSVAIDGDTVVVGAHLANPGGIGDAGAAYVFAKPGAGWSTTSTFTAKLTASDGSEGDTFGDSVAISGETVVVGAPNANPGGISNAGAAYVFTMPGEGWAGSLTESAKLTEVNQTSGDSFGQSVAIDGDVVVVGAPLDFVSSKYFDEGAAYVFVKPGGGWTGNLTEDAMLRPFHRETEGYSGKSVAISGDTVVVGAPGYGPNIGLAFVYVKPIDGWAGTLTETGVLRSSDRSFDDQFGGAVAITGTIVVVGAPNAEQGTIDDAGAAYVFIKPVAGWGNQTENAKLTASDGISGDWLGYSVTISGDTIVAGSPSNAAYLFDMPVGGWETCGIPCNETIILTATFWAGNSVAMSGNTVLVGANEDASYKGSTFVFVKNITPVITEGASVGVTMSEDGSPTPFSLTLNATDVDGDTLTWSILTQATNGTASASGTGLSKAIGYTPNANHSGSDSFVVQVSDGNGGTDSITVNVTIDSIPDPPEFTSTAVISATEDVLYTYNVTASDPDGGSLTITAPTKPAWLTLTDNGDGTATLSGTPTNSDVGDHDVTLRVSDGDLFAEQSFTVTVSNVNDPPVITEGASVDRTISEDGSPDPFDLTLHATDVDVGDTLTWSILTQATNGVASASGTGLSKAISYAPNANYNGSDSFVVQVSDGNGGTDSITVNVTIEPVNELIYLPVIFK